MNFRSLRAALVLAALASAGCATAPAAEPAATAQPAAFDAAGTYTFSARMGAETLPGTLLLTRGPGGAYTGTVSTASTGDMPVRAVQVDGSRIRVTAQGRGGQAVLNLEMDGRSFTGDWSYGPNGGALSGRMQPAS